jgi:hypothetical protein
MNCKPGDLAIIIASDFPEEIGMVVEVLPDSLVDEEFGFCWHIRAKRPVACWDPATGKDVFNSEFCVPDSDLRPVTGLPVHDEVTDDIKEPA